MADLGRILEKESFVVSPRLDADGSDIPSDTFCAILYPGSEPEADQRIRRHLARTLRLPTILVLSEPQPEFSWGWPIVAVRHLDDLDPPQLRRELELLRQTMQGLRETGSRAAYTGNDKNEFLTTLSRTIRTPMNGILGMADLALTKTQEPSVRQHVEMIRYSAQALLTTLDDLLGPWRLEVGKNGRNGFSPNGSPQKPGLRPEIAGQPTQKACPTESLSVLLVEDNKVNQLFTKEMLLDEGHSVVVVENGQEALEILARQRFDMVLMDIQMPVMDGVEATRAIRDPASDVLDHAVPIVALTAHAVKGDRERFMQAGMTDYLTKPVDFRKLFGIMADLFSHRLHTPHTPHKQTSAGKSPLHSQAAPKLNGQPIDQEWLDKMLASRKNFLKRMFTVFVQEEPLRLEKTRIALEAGDMDILRFLSHSIKGATATMGASKAKDSAAALEQAAKDQDRDAAQKRFALLEEEMVQVLDFMRDFLAAEDA